MFECAPSKTTNVLSKAAISVTSCLQSESFNSFRNFFTSNSPTQPTADSSAAALHERNSSGEKEDEDQETVQKRNRVSTTRRSSKSTVCVMIFRLHLISKLTAHAITSCNISRTRICKPPSLVALCTNLVLIRKMRRNGFRHPIFCSFQRSSERVFLLRRTRRSKSCTLVDRCTLVRRLFKIRESLLLYETCLLSGHLQQATKYTYTRTRTYPYLYS